MQLTIQPLSDVMGAEVIGLDLTQPMDDATKAQVNDAFLEHLVLCFRDQRFDLDSYSRAAHQLGTPKSHLYSQVQVQEHPEISVVSSEDRDVHGSGKKFARATHFHTDESYREVPPKATMLYAVEVPRQGGETRFVNMYRAYETLPDETKARIDGRKAIHHVSAPRPDIVLPKLTEEEYAKSPEVEQPIVRTHDETGRKALYVNRARTFRICGMEPDESEDLLLQLFEHSTEMRFQYHHHWRKGDLVMWDNRCTLHAATANYDPDKERRLLYRILLTGKRPV